MTREQTKALRDALRWLRVADICWRLCRLCLWSRFGWICLSCTVTRKKKEVPGHA